MLNAADTPGLPAGKIVFELGNSSFPAAPRPGRSAMDSSVGSALHKADPSINLIGTKDIGEVSLLGVAAAVANEVFNAAGKRIWKLPVTPKKLI